MNNSDLVLNIAVNLGRLGRWVAEGKYSRVEPFLKDTQNYLDQLDNRSLNDRFKKTYIIFRNQFDRLKEDRNYSLDWAETALTWANILTHRAKLA